MNHHLQIYKDHCRIYRIIETIFMNNIEVKQHKVTVN